MPGPVKDASAYCPNQGVSESRAEEPDRDDLPNVRCHSAWYFRSRRHAISVGMPLQARHDNSKTIGVEATSTSANAMGGRRYGRPDGRSLTRTGQPATPAPDDRDREIRKRFGLADQGRAGGGLENGRRETGRKMVCSFPKIGSSGKALVGVR